MTTIRQRRVAELLYEELTILIGNELDDPTLSLLTVTNVEVSRDLRVAKIQVHHQNDDVNRRTVLRNLSRAASFLRSQLAQRISLRAVPELLFYYDDSPEQAARVDELLARIRDERDEDLSAPLEGTEMDAEMDAESIDGVLDEEESEGGGAR